MPSKLKSHTSHGPKVGSLLSRNFLRQPVSASVTAPPQFIMHSYEYAGRNGLDEFLEVHRFAYRVSSTVSYISYNIQDPTVFGCAEMANVPPCTTNAGSHNSPRKQ